MINKKHVNNDKKILFITNSFGNSLCPYILLDTKEIDMVMINSEEHDVKKYISENNPDLVIVMYSVTAIDQTGEKFSFK